MMPIRISATQSDIIKERWDREGPSRGWKPAAGPWTSCNPPILTLDEGTGVLNQGLRILSGCAGGIIPSRFLIRILMQRLIEQAHCPNPIGDEVCQGNLRYFTRDNQLETQLDWSFDSGFVVRSAAGRRPLRTTFSQDTRISHANAEHSTVRCDQCGWTLDDGLKPNSIRPMFRYTAKELGLIEAIGTSRVCLDTSLPRRERAYFDSHELLRLTDVGRAFVAADLADDRAARVAALTAACAVTPTRNDERLPTRGLQSESARECHVFSVLTEGYPYRDTARFIQRLLDVRQGIEEVPNHVGWSDMAVMQCYYGRDFDQSCEGCAMRDVCPLRADLASAGLGVSDDGCLPNLIAFCEAVRTGGGINMEEYHPNPDAVARHRCIRFRWNADPREFDWTEEVTKETPIPFNISVALGNLNRTGNARTCRISRRQQE